MQIFTYCSFKGSKYGYQYAYFDDCYKGIIASYLASERTDRCAISETFIRWCECKNGWQLVLIRLPNGDYFLMIGQLEKSKEMKKTSNIEDYPYYITIAFQGIESDIQQLALVFFYEFFNDKYSSIYDSFVGDSTHPGIIGKIADSTKYTIDTTKLFDLLESKTREHSMPPQFVKGKSHSLFFIPKRTWLSADEAVKNRLNKFERKDRINKCLNNLNNFTGISSDYVFLIAYKYFIDDTPFETRIDYEYFP